jgi:hypothetical protein
MSRQAERLSLFALRPLYFYIYIRFCIGTLKIILFCFSLHTEPRRMEGGGRRFLRQTEIFVIK